MVRVTVRNKEWSANVVCGTRTAILGIDTSNIKHLERLSGFTIRKGRLVNGKYEWECISNRTLYVVFELERKNVNDVTHLK